MKAEFPVPKVGEKLYVKHGIFFVFRDTKLICWNYVDHEEYELSDVYFARLREIATGGATFTGDSIDAELLQGGLIQTKPDAVKWNWGKLSHIFHFGTQNLLPKDLSGVPAMNFSRYFRHCASILPATPELIMKREGRSIELPAADLSTLQNVGLWDSLRRRKTTRDFFGEKLPLRTVSTILYAVFGAVHGAGRQDIEKFGIKSFGYRRTSASGGGLQSTEPYLLNFRIEGLELGAYHYHSLEHRLYKVADDSNLSAKDIGLLTGGQNYSANLTFVVCLVMRLDKLWWKYGSSRAYRVAILDIGHLSQTFQIVCAGLSVCTWISGALFDDELNKRLGLDSNRESCMLVLGGGVGSGEPVGKEIIAGIENWTAAEATDKLADA